MKTLNDLYTEVVASDALKAEFLALKAPEDVVAFAKKHGCDATLDEIKVFLEEKQKAAGELSEAELEQVAGGKSVSEREVKYSILTVGIGCAFAYGMSKCLSDGKTGTDIKGEGMLCSTDGNRDSDVHTKMML